MLEKLKGKRLGIVEEALCGYSAHWFEWIRAVKLINEDYGVNVRVAGHISMDRSAAEALPAEPLLKSNSWDERFHRLPSFARYSHVFLHNWRVYRECQAVLRKWGPVDCLQIPVVRIHQLMGCLALVKTHGGRSFKRLVMQLNIPPGRHSKGHNRPVFDRNTILLRKVLQAYRPHLDTGLVCLGSDSDQTARDFQLLTGLPFVEFPTPRVAMNAKQASIQRLPDTAVVFTCLGPSRYEKGSDLFLEAIRLYLQSPERRPARFVIQWTSDFKSKQGDTVGPDAWLASHPDVKLHRRALTSAEYDEELLNSDCIVMPYRWESYYNRISGLAVEAATAGIPVIFTEDTWLERAMKRYGAGLAFKNGDVSDLVAKLKRMAAELPEFQKLARERVNVAKKINSPENFLQLLWGYL